MSEGDNRDQQGWCGLPEGSKRAAVWVGPRTGRVHHDAAHRPGEFTHARLVQEVGFGD